MIQANELRIGNYINQIEHQNGFCNEIRIVTAIRQEGYLNVRIIGKHNMGSHMINWFEPISLTEEWLIKFWFDRSGLYHVKDQVYIYESSSGRIADYEYRFNYTESPMFFVHQLQNLYFCLVGEELKIK